MKNPDRIPPRGRRATIIRAAARQERTLSDIVREVRTVAKLRIRDASIDRLKTNGAVQDLRQQGLLARTAHGYRATPAGLALLQASEERHA
ncbi:hypothetical protein D3C71_1348430 [compost metagenome]